MAAPLRRRPVDRRPIHSRQRPPDDRRRCPAGRFPAPAADGRERPGRPPGVSPLPSGHDEGSPRSAVPARRGPDAPGRDPGAGDPRDRRDRSANLEGVRGLRHRRTRLQDGRSPGGRRAGDPASAPRALRRRRDPAADRMRERREPSDRPRGGAPAGDRVAPRARRGTAAAAAAVPRRGTAARRPRRAHRPLCRAPRSAAPAHGAAREPRPDLCGPHRPGRARLHRGDGSALGSAPFARSPVRGLSRGSRHGAPGRRPAVERRRAFARTSAPRHGPGRPRRRAARRGRSRGAHLPGASARRSRFRPGGVLTFRLALPWNRYSNPATRNEFVGRLQNTVSALPGVTAVEAISHLPYDHLPNWAALTSPARARTNRQRTWPTTAP